MKHTEHILNIIAVLLAIMWPCDSNGCLHSYDDENDVRQTPKQHTDTIIGASGDTTYIYRYDPVPLVPCADTDFSDDEQDQGDDEATIGGGTDNTHKTILRPQTLFGRIPLSDGVSPTGARTYEIPITTASGYQLTPSVSLAYNSQSGNGVAGYGWNVAGGSAITVVPKSIHYDGEVSALNLSDPTTCAFSLDGTRLVRNIGQTADYQYETAQGFILVKAHKVGRAVAYFTVAYPNGNTATFGFTDNHSQSMQPVYPITELHDRRGNRIDFSYTESGGCLYLSKISYGGRSADSHQAEIAFNYIGRTDVTTIYVGGKAMRADRLLESIVSTDVVGGKNKNICLCMLNHKEDGVNRLVSVNYYLGEKSLPGITFEYGAGEMGKMPELTKKEGLGIMKYYSKGYDINPVYIRGKLVAGSYSDGILTLPGCYDTYTKIREHVVGKVRIPVYGSGYPANQGILIAPRLSMYSHVDSIYTESGFQAIQTVDVDGDGTDEIVKINFAGASKNSTSFKVSVYGNGGSITTPQTFTFSIGKSLDAGANTYSPAQCAYMWGNFRGDGKVQLLLTAYTPNEEKSLFMYLVDVSEKKCSDCCLTLTDYDVEKSLPVMPLDIDGDGRAELCRAVSGGVTAYRLNGQRFTISGTDKTLTADALGERAVFGDVNGDGKMDIMVAPKESFHNVARREAPVWAPSRCPMCGYIEPILDYQTRACRGCKGDIVQYYAGHKESWVCRGCYSVLVVPDDLNYGRPVCRVHGAAVVCNVDLGYVDNGARWTVFTSTGTTFVKSEADIAANERGDNFMLVDMDHDGLCDLVRMHNYDLTLHLNVCGNIQSEGSCRTYIPYDAQIIPSNVCNTGSMSSLITVEGPNITTYAYSQDFSRLNLLTQLYGSYGIIHTNYYKSLTDNDRCYSTAATVNTAYPYALMMRPLLLLSLGIKKSDGLPQIEDLSYSYCNAVYNNEGLGFLGFEKTSVHDNISGKTAVTTCDPRMLGAVTRVETPDRVQTTQYACDTYANRKMNPKAVSAADTDLLTGVTVGRATVYDQYNNPTSVTTSYGPVQQTVQTIAYKNTATADCYIVGLPTSTSTTTTRGTESWTTRETVDYGTNHMPSTRTSYVGGGKVSTTRYAYDSFGNVVSELSAPYNVTEFKGTKYTYDTTGRHVLSSTNALGQTTKYSDYDMLGNACTVEDYRGRVYTYRYDEAGRLLHQTNPDETSMSAGYVWTDKDRQYSILTTYTEKPKVEKLYDVLDRETRSGVQRFDGKWQYVNKEYDKLGRLSRVSLPYLDGETPTKWATYEYDTHNRPTRCLEASGRETRWSYNGLSTTETKDGVSTTRTLDATGALVKVEDAGGVVSYTLRPDGQPSRIVAPGNAVTSFEYDQFGRRTSIDDPSFGVQTSTETYAADGTCTKVSTDAAGKSVTTVYDMYGRRKSETRPELKTTYEYDGDGNMTQERSSNEVHVTCTYDEFGRLKTRTKTVRDKSVTKTYEYIDGQLTSEKVNLNSGSLGVTSFSLDYNYANGHLKEIVFNKNIPVWRLKAGNAFGQPTSVQTGNLSRTYGYDAYGLPTLRAAGQIQAFAYKFDPKTGNLVSRTDARRKLTETFGYDNLNRLVNVNGQTVRYAKNGNLLSMPGVGTMEYADTDRPYAVTGLTRTVAGKDVADQTIKYNSFHSPSLIEADGFRATFIYDGSGNRVCMSTSNNAVKYYIDEYEVSGDGRQQVVYIGGDAYTAPMAYIRNQFSISTSSWSLVNICRDHLGSITHIAGVDGNLMREYSYDAWGNLRNPDNHKVYDDPMDADLYLGRGYVGHEHLPRFGLINMNARLYDPETGRFLSPDPYVQMPDCSQNFNRYSYCMNNPLKYVDRDGKLAWFVPVIIGAAVGSYVGASIYSNTFAFWNWKSGAWKGAVTGGIIGGTLGYFVSAGIGASGLTVGAAGKASISKAAGITSSIINGGTSNIFWNFVMTGDMSNSWKAGISGMAAGAWGITGGFGLLTGASENLTRKLAYQMTGTTLNSIGDNWTNGQGLFSKLTLGIGPVNLTLGKGQKLLQWQNNICNIGMNAFGLLNGLFGGKITFDKNNLTAIYTGGLIDNMYPPEESVDAVGFSPFVVTGNSKLHSDLNTFEHEVHHLWHSRVLGERYFINYGLQGIAAWLQNCSFLEKMNFYETIAYNRFWW